MTRKDCKLIADAIASLNFTAKNKAYIGAVIAEKLKDTNPAFNSRKFIEACVPQLAR